MDFIPFLLSSPLNQMTFAVMGLLLLEVIAVCIWSELLRRRVISARRVIGDVRGKLAAFKETPISLSRRVTRFLGGDVARARHLLGTLEEVGPIIGLALTLLAFAIALPGFWADLTNDPNIFFQKIGMAVGSSCIGITIKLLCFVQGRRLDAATDVLKVELGFMDSDTDLNEVPS